MRTKYIQWGIQILILGIISLIVTGYSLSRGEISIPLFKIPGILMRGEGTIEYTVLTNIRIPRIYMGLSIGGALSLAGVLLQGIYRNPLVEPYTLGISGGAALGVALAIVFGIHLLLGHFMLPAFGFAGALITVFLVYFLSARQGKIRIQNMVLIGVMVSFIASSVMMFLLSITTSENVHGIIFWIMGSLSETEMPLITAAVVISFLSLCISYLFIQPLNALRVGEEKARHLGINTDLSIRILFIIASLLTGVCVSIAGIIGFVGLVIPQLIRLIVGPDYRILLISSFLFGGSFLVLCDTLARVIIAPNELPVGVITGIIGGVSFIVILVRSGQQTKLNKMQ